MSSKNILDETLLNYLAQHPNQSSKTIHDGINFDVSYATVKRHLKQLIERGYVVPKGSSRATRYDVAKGYALLRDIDMSSYFMDEIDDRVIQAQYNFQLVDQLLPAVSIFNEDEMDHLQQLQAQYERNIHSLDEQLYQKELERLAIDLSWKSSQIEGNTYSLLETERLLKEKKTADGKTRDEATMLLNHKSALDFILQHTDYVDPLRPRAIEDIHSLLVEDLNVDRNIRSRAVGISGTNYRPLDNEYQIREALDATCALVNNKVNVFEKALLTLVLLSYIQAFNDGNKRTARMVTNAILMHYQYCPLSFRTVGSMDYKKAMLIFYEQNNISAMKKIFIDQYDFAVNTYFR